MAKKKFKAKQRSDFYIEFIKEIESILGENYRPFWNKRSEEIHHNSSPKINRLTTIDLAVITEALCKAQGKPYKRYYKKSYKKNFTDLMREKIEEGDR